ncbi:MAG: L-histidine N(alpha)-methyltransferase [Pseudomonadales bacterium]|nr:L-histidine N(alpha)-methyltransferase [Gammaproteobacteria bacterium]NNL57471.1 L-histidine N(alpha)-methyltransferase [Pseudomonadales bacterium]
MNQPQQQLAENYYYSEYPLASQDCRAEILAGLGQCPKAIAPKYFYDMRGSQLFERITRTPEYYPTVTELGLYQRYAQEIAQACGTGAVVLEPGSGNSEKIRLLLNALAPSAYAGFDIAGEFLQRAAGQLASEYPWLDVFALRADFNQLQQLPAYLEQANKLIFYPGSTIGNMQPAQAIDFIKTLRGWLAPGDGGLLIGIDLHKDTATLERAYNDKQGVTAAFNKNILCHINTLLGSNFDPDAFAHRAVYNVAQQRIEMYLDCVQQQCVAYPGGELVVERGESLHTEYSYKYTVEGIERLASEAGFRVQQQWLDAARLFSITLMQPV